MTLIPAWITRYPRQHLHADVLAGVIVAILVIPQSLAYALLAGLPPQAGLYASIVPVLVYAWLGSSMTQALGPVAITAIMTSALLAPLASPGSAQYVGLAAALSIFSGLLILGFGLLRLGFLSQLLSRPVVSGFISGSAVLIVISQLKVLLGIPVSGYSAWYQLVNVVQNLGDAHAVTALTSCLAMVALLVARYWLGRWAQGWGWSKASADMLVRIMPLVVLATGTLAVVAGNLDHTHRLAVVGAIDDSTSAWSFVMPGWNEMHAIATAALTLAFIGTVQSITMAQALAVKRRERVDANQELIGLGAANVVAGFYGGMPVGGGLSRTAVNTAAGAQTPLASVVAALAMLVIVLAGTQWLERMPVAVLAANIVVAAIGMIDLKALRKAWAYDRADAWALLGTAAGVLVLGLEQGIATGIGLSLVTLLLRTSTPHIAVIGRIAGTEHFRNVERHGVQTIPGVLLLRIDESLFFGNLNAVESRLGAELERAPNVRDVVLIMSAVNRVDTTAMEALTDLNHELLERGISLHLAEVKGPVQDRLVNAPLWRNLSGQVHLSVNAAYEALEKKHEAAMGWAPSI